MYVFSDLVRREALNQDNNKGISMVIMETYSITIGPPGGLLKAMPAGMTITNTMPAEETITTKRMAGTRIITMVVDMMDCQFGNMFPLLF